MSADSDKVSVQTIFSMVDNLDAATHAGKIKQSFTGIRELLKQNGWSLAALDQSKNPSETRMEKLFRQKQANAYLRVVDNRCQRLRKDAAVRESDVQLLAEEVRFCLDELIELLPVKQYARVEEEFRDARGKAYFHLGMEGIRELEQLVRPLTIAVIEKKFRQTVEWFEQAEFSFKADNLDNDEKIIGLRLREAYLGAFRKSGLLLLEALEARSDLPRDIRQEEVDDIERYFRLSYYDLDKAGSGLIPYHRLSMAKRLELATKGDNLDLYLATIGYTHKRLSGPKGPTLPNYNLKTLELANLELPDWSKSAEEVRAEYSRYSLLQKIGRIEKQLHLDLAVTKFAILRTEVQSDEIFTAEIVNACIMDIDRHLFYANANRIQLDPANQPTMLDIDQCFAAIVRRGHYNSAAQEIDEFCRKPLAQQLESHKKSIRQHINHAQSNSEFPTREDQAVIATLYRRFNAGLEVQYNWLIRKQGQPPRFGAPGL